MGPFVLLQIQQIHIVLGKLFFISMGHQRRSARIIQTDDARIITHNPVYRSRSQTKYKPKHTG